MSLATTLQFVKALATAGSQVSDRVMNQHRTLPQTSPAVRSQYPDRALEAVLLLVSRDVAGLDDSEVISLLATTCLCGRPYRDLIDQHTTVHVVVRSYAQDARIGRAWGQQMFRRLLDEHCDEKRMTTVTFEAGCGAGVIIAQWRPESQAAEDGMSDTGETAAMSHWSWWAERMLTKEGYA